MQCTYHSGFWKTKVNQGTSPKMPQIVPFAVNAKDSTLCQWVQDKSPFYCSHTCFLLIKWSLKSVNLTYLMGHCDLPQAELMICWANDHWDIVPLPGMFSLRYIDDRVIPCEAYSVHKTECHAKSDGFCGRITMNGEDINFDDLFRRSVHMF